MGRDLFFQALDRLESAQHKAHRLPDELSFITEVSRWHRLRHDLEEYRSELAALRGEGYTWWPELEVQLERALSRAPSAHAAMWFEIDGALRNTLPRVEAAVQELQALAFRGDFEAESARIDERLHALELLEMEVDDVTGRVRAAIRPVEDALSSFEYRWKDVRRTLDLHRSSPLFPAEEQPVVALRATWEDRPGGKAEGFLLFTDRRIGFEEYVEHEMKTGLLSSETHVERRPLLAEPFSHLAASEDETRGWFLKDQLLVFHWRAEANAPPRTTFEVEDEDAEHWDDLVDALREGRVEDRHARPEALVRLDELSRQWESFRQAHRRVSEGPGTSATQEKVLHDLITDLFTPEELRHFLVMELQRKDLAMNLPGPEASAAMVYFEAATAIVRRGCADARFFQILERARPDRLPRVERARAALRMVGAGPSVNA